MGAQGAKVSPRNMIFVIRNGCSAGWPPPSSPAGGRYSFAFYLPQGARFKFGTEHFAGVAPFAMRAKSARRDAKFRRAARPGKQCRRGPRERSTGMGLRGPHAGASTSGARGAAALGPAPIKEHVGVEEDA